MRFSELNAHTIPKQMVEKRKGSYRPLVYICSPYAGNVEANVRNAKRYSRFAFEQNVIPVTPHLLYPQFMNDDNKAEREAAMHFNYVLLGKCDELWVFGDVISAGMAYEISVANRRKQKIRYFTSDCKEVTTCEI